MTPDELNDMFLRATEPIDGEPPKDAMVRVAVQMCMAMPPRITKDQTVEFLAGWLVGSWRQGWRAGYAAATPPPRTPTSHRDPNSWDPSQWIEAR